MPPGSLACPGFTKDAAGVSSKSAPRWIMIRVGGGPSSCPFRGKCAFIFPCRFAFSKIQQESRPLHYWLRAIEGVQFRFDNFSSHFIRVQIFQIDFSTLPLILSAFKYFRMILKRPNEHFSISFSHYHAIETLVQQLRKEKGTS